MAKQEGAAKAQQAEEAAERREVAEQMLEWRLTYQEGRGSRVLGENVVVYRTTGAGGQVNNYRRGVLAEAVAEMGAHVNSQGRKHKCTREQWETSLAHPAARLHIPALDEGEEQERQAKVRRMMGTKASRARLVQEIRRVMDEVLPSLAEVKEREEEDSETED